MAVSIPNVNGLRNDEEKIIGFAATTVAALCYSLKNSAKDVHKYKHLMPLLIAALTQCPCNAQHLLLDLLNGLHDLVVAGDKSDFVHSQYQISKIMDPIMETLPVGHPLFCEFLSSFDRLCRLLKDNAMSLKRSLIKMCIRALRFPLNEDGTAEAAMVKKAKSIAFKFISKWIVHPNSFGKLAEELFEVVFELIEDENEIEKLKMYVKQLPDLLKIVQYGQKIERNSILKSRWMWSKIRRILQKLIEEDRDEQLTILCVKEIALCIPKIETPVLAETELDEIGSMVKKLVEKETEMRDIERETEHNNTTEDSGGLLDGIVTIFLRLFQKKVPICNILYPIMPIVFRLIEKCSNKHWGLRFLTTLHIYVPEFALEFHEDIVPLLFRSLTDNQTKIRQLAAHAFGQMAESKIAELKEIAVYSLDFICQLISRPDAKLPGSIVATEDAIATVIKIIENCDEKMIGTGRISEILSRFLSWFPLSGLSSECPVAYKFLLDLIDSNHPQITGGEPNANSPRLLCILTKAIHDEAVTREGNVEERVVNKIKEIANSSESLNDWIRRSGLNRDEKATLKRILNSRV